MVQRTFCQNTAGINLFLKKEDVKLRIFLMVHTHKLWTAAVCIFAGRSNSERAILVAPYAGSSVSAITFPLRAAFHLGPFTETFQAEKGIDGKR